MDHSPRTTRFRLRRSRRQLLENAVSALYPEGSCRTTPSYEQKQMIEEKRGSWEAGRINEKVARLATRMDDIQQAIDGIRTDIQEIKERLRV
jgi:hypothetical protein